MLDGDLALDFHPLAGINRYKRFNRAGAHQKLGILFARGVGDEALNTAQRKTVGLRDGIVICVHLTSH